MYIMVGVFFGFILVAAIWLVFFYNRLADYKDEVDAGWRKLGAELEDSYSLLSKNPNFLPFYTELEQELISILNKVNRGFLDCEGFADKILAFFKKTIKQLDEMLESGSQDLDGYLDTLIALRQQFVEKETSIIKAIHFYNFKIAAYNSFISKKPNKLTALILNIRTGEPLV